MHIAVLSVDVLLGRLVGFGILVLQVGSDTASSLECAHPRHLRPDTGST